MLHPSLLDLAREQARAGIRHHAARRGQSEAAYTAEVRRHLAQLLKGCRVYIRVMEERLEHFLEHDLLPVMGEFEHPAPTPRELQRRKRNEAQLLRATDEPLTYGYLSENGRQARAYVYGSIVLEIKPTEAMRWIHGDSGAMLHPESNVRMAPSRLTQPDVLSWDWVNGPCPLEALRPGEVHLYPEYLEVLMPERVTWAQIQAVLFESEYQAVAFGGRVLAKIGAKEAHMIVERKERGAAW